MLGEKASSVLFLSIESDSSFALCRKFANSKLESEAKSQ